ncbi:MAG TPA: hypothetical protein VHE81_01195 [Lacipirellulaceae bacterium]|nr:hypothetical protein [Lacipirellulaceae bacterium]
MKRISTVELLRSFGAYSDAALMEPIVLTKNGRDRLVLISVKQYEMLQHNYDASEDPRRGTLNQRTKPGRRNAVGDAKADRRDRQRT